jgi:DNA-binding transcriptional MerR regulator
MSAERTFTLPELALLVGVEYRTLHNWVRRGLLAASLARADGSGTRNLFDLADARDAYVLADLRRAGVELSKLQAVAEWLRQTREDRATSEVLLVNGRVSGSTRSQLAHAVARMSPALVYDLAHADLALRARLGAAPE